MNTRLRDLRLAKNLTQKQIADRCGITPAHYWYIEHGQRTPSIAVAKKLASVLETTLDRLYG